MITLTVTIEQEGEKGVSVTARTRCDNDTGIESFTADVLTAAMKEGVNCAMQAVGATKSDFVEAPPGELFEKLCNDVKNRIRKET